MLTHISKDLIKKLDKRKRQNRQGVSDTFVINIRTHHKWTGTSRALDGILFSSTIDNQKHLYYMPYHPDSFLGQGAFGKVRKAYYVNPETRAIEYDTFMVVKENKALRQMSMEKEAKATKQYRGFAQRYQKGSTEYLLMPYIPGKPMYDSKKYHDTTHGLHPEIYAMPFEERITLVISLVQEVVNIIEPTGVGTIPGLHRDIKLANCKFEKDETDKKNHRVHILDFGFARPLMPDKKDESVNTVSTATTRARKMTFVGTPTHLSPEQIEKEEIGPKSEVYALVLCILRLLNANNPESGRVHARQIIHNTRYRQKGAYNYNLKGLFENLAVPSWAKRPITEFLDMMQSHYYEDRPHIHQVLRFFLLVKNTIIAEKIESTKEVANHVESLNTYVESLNEYINQVKHNIKQEKAQAITLRNLLPDETLSTLIERHQDKTPSGALKFAKALSERWARKIDSRRRSIDRDSIPLYIIMKLKEHLAGKKPEDAEVKQEQTSQAEKSFIEAAIEAATILDYGNDEPTAHAQTLGSAAPSPSFT